MSTVRKEKSWSFLMGTTLLSGDKSSVCLMLFIKRRKWESYTLNSLSFILTVKYREASVVKYPGAILKMELSVNYVVSLHRTWKLCMLTYSEKSRNKTCKMAKANSTGTLLMFVIWLQWSKWSAQELNSFNKSTTSIDMIQG